MELKPLLLTNLIMPGKARQSIRTVTYLCEIRRTYRVDVKLEHFFHISGNTRLQVVYTPVDRRVSNDYRPHSLRRQQTFPRCSQFLDSNTP